MLDWLQLDQAIHAAVLAWREHCSELLAAAPLQKQTPIPPALCSLETLQALSEYDEPLSRALAAWVAVLHSESAVWPLRLRLAQGWRAADKTGDPSNALTLTAIRDQVLSLARAEERQAFAQRFVARAALLATPARTLLTRRFELNSSLKSRYDAFLVDPCPPALVLEFARGLLARTDDLATEERHPNWVSGLRASLGVEASEGWPARLTARWVTGLFAGTAIGEQLRLPALRLPRAWGATSFARALAIFGAAVLDASRNPKTPFVLHQTPLGTRRHQRRALFASLIAEPSFARRALGLGRERARTQQRAVARALLAHLRIDALRILSAEAWRTDPDNIDEAFSSLAQRALGPGAPPALFALLPQLRPDDGPRLIGLGLAKLQRAALIEHFDEDWFINPRAIAYLRASDAGPDNAEVLSAPILQSAQDELLNTLETAIA